MVVGPQGALKCRSSTIADRADSGPILRVLLSFGGPRAISMIYNPRGAFASLSSTLIVLANSDAIRGLLLII